MWICIWTFLLITLCNICWETPGPRGLNWWLGELWSKSTNLNLQDQYYILIWRLVRPQSTGRLVGMSYHFSHSFSLAQCTLKFSKVMWHTHVNNFFPPAKSQRWHRAGGFEQREGNYHYPPTNVPVLGFLAKTIPEFCPLYCPCSHQHLCPRHCRGLSLPVTNQPRHSLPRTGSDKLTGISLPPLDRLEHSLFCSLFISCSLTFHMNLEKIPVYTA